MKLPSLIELITDSFGICLNANDFFGYAQSDSVLLQAEDLGWVLPLYERYGQDAINAVMTCIAQKDNPTIEPLSNYRTQAYKQAMAEIKQLSPKIYSNYY